MDQIQQQLQDRLDPQGISLTEKQLEQFELYYKELVSWNERMNLTGITEREQVYTKHFYDSVSLSFYVDMNKIQTLADIGSGAGFPGIPLKICYPHLKLTIIDSLNKRINFLQHIVDTLGLTDVELIHGRAEELGRRTGYRDHYDLVTARAVARLAVLNEFCLPFVRKEGIFAAMKGSDPTEELLDAQFSLKELKAKVINTHAFQLPVEESARHIIVIGKTSSTPKKYPRKPGMPLKMPLVK
ncbi:16S rRNA (guanine(527)-N(7))-methyltransferase RsmG [Paenibacillus urinalis]|uniref:Ribosomal RNA small subunit methyltransferase G n=1 Tax=Paenibacillus urinalis TaxID=521520 RepID=A0ABY7X9U2_9BACL|nr:MULTISPECIES: 16S rRNA (guanine(527)-N(7))-methyltransferase RsmG [Paenibacillus]WDH98752.1 16S rRNA (guanine(527)-N(7))-methyltransferase RsmG [Paenibacillus urinalis]WDI02446.1 16S rRNA (guanine(527)-N(7))-methyltransferase RsmG [Paenibacillus urinalis]GAK41464.1 ribosomal RNA small subunit methyltransferase G [Paenibacillus sp. TCA20]